MERTCYPCSFVCDSIECPGCVLDIYFPSQFDITQLQILSDSIGLEVVRSLVYEKHILGGSCVVDWIRKELDSIERSKANRNVSTVVVADVSPIHSASSSGLSTAVPTTSVLTADALSLASGSRQNVHSEDFVSLAVAAVAPITSATSTGLSIAAPPATAAPSAAASAADALAAAILRRRSIYDECVLNTEDPDVPDNADVFLLTEEQRRGGSRGGYGGGSGPARRFHGGNRSHPY